MIRNKFTPAPFLRRKRHLNSWHRPGFGNTGWGVIEVDKAQKRHSANGVIHTFSREAHVFRLRRIAEELAK